MTGSDRRSRVRAGSGTLPLSKSPVRRARCDAREHWVWRAERREEGGTGDVAVGRIVDAAKIVGHGVSDVVAHAHCAGVVVCRAEVVATVLSLSERREDRKPLRPGAGGNRDGAGRAGENLEWLIASKDQRDLIGDRIHRIPCIAVIVRLRTTRKFLSGWLWRCRDGRRPWVVRNRVSRVDRSMKLSGLRGVISPMPRMVMTTVSSFARQHRLQMFERRGSS